MAEIKHVFSQGKMNKDLDERLVPNGQYRDALNIQVSTSEGSDVGTVQNILGNLNLHNYDLIPAGSKCVGAIADEKKNTFYWLTAHQYKDAILKYDGETGLITPVIIDTNRNVLNFNNSGEILVTGINIIDNLLLWTDNINEPKKINIDLCIQGTDNTGFYHTHLISPKTNIQYSDNILLEEEHITVIKKSPLTPILIKSEFEKRIISILQNQNPFALNNVLKEVDDTFECTCLNFAGGFSYEVSDELLFLNGPGNLPDQFHVRAKVLEDLSGQTNPFGGTFPSNHYKCRILSISPTTPTNSLQGSFQLSYHVEKVISSKILFNKKFPRFSYRWRYEDGEYSTFAPFTEPIFSPGKFEYDGKNGFNKAMDNYLISLELRNFLPFYTPKNVVQVDILYKESNSPVVYIVDKIKYNDHVTINVGNPSTTINSWNANVYEIKTDLIYATVPANQLLRPWDNVPRQALAQEVVGNRVVYGNYLQNYNLDIKPALQSQFDVRYPSNNKYIVDFVDNYSSEPFLTEQDISPSSDQRFYGQKSLKSEREYQIGITYLDKYGRETPVFSDTKSTFDVPKTRSRFKSLISTKQISDAPFWAEYYKIYVKENSNEYYNLAMDRLYQAEDGSYWLSFPSSERNKIDEESYITLKKGIDENGFVNEEAKYKVIDISNAPPQFVKEKIIQVGVSSVTSTASMLQTSQPLIGQRFFEIDEETWTSAGNAKLNTIDSRLTLFFKSGVKISRKYEIMSVDLLENAGVDDGDLYKIVLDRPIDSEDQWIYPNFPTIINSSTLLPDIDPNLTIKIHKAVEEYSRNYEGRFFVKIHGDSLIQKYLVPSTLTQEYEVLARIDSYYLKDGNASTYANGTLDNTGRNISDDEEDWVQNFDFNNPEDGEEDREWFIDQTYFSGTFPLNTEDDDIYKTAPYNFDGTLRSNYDGVSAIAGYGRGIFEISGQVYMEISYGQVGEDIIWEDGTPWDNVTDGSGNTVWKIDAQMMRDFENDKSWVLGSSLNPSDVSQAAVVSQLQDGSIFKISGDTNDTIYTISGGPQLIRRINHTRWQEVVDKFYLWAQDSFQLEDGTGSEWDRDTYVQFRERLRSFMKANNRRVTYRIPLDKDPRTESSFNLVEGDASNNTFPNADDDDAIGLEFITPVAAEDSFLSIKSPAIWETEPKENVDIDIYYEASQAYPLKLNLNNWSLYVPKGCVVSTNNQLSMAAGVVTRVLGFTGTAGPAGQFVTTYPSVLIQFDQLLDPSQIIVGQSFRFEQLNGGYTVLFLASTAVFQNQSYAFWEDTSKCPVGLNWFNCYSFGNGVESNRIRDDFNQVTIDKGAKASSTIDTTYEQERRSSGLIYSGLYNSTSGVNNLNQFIQAEKITKDLNPSYGSIQKLYSRNSDLLAFCEDKVLRILANKDAVFNADGNPNLTATNRVLGQSIPFSGDYGISKNPESFAADSYRIYFTDKQRGSVLRLSRDGITPISKYGMEDYFKENLKLNIDKIVGSYDDIKNNYNLTLISSNITVSFDETVNGWSSFKSFVPEKAISMGNDYYTFKDGLAYKHHTEIDQQGFDIDRNTFYGMYYKSSIGVILNDQPGLIKSYKTLKYEGSQSNVNQEITDVRTGYYNLKNKDGWYAEDISTDKETGFVPEFIEKEGKWFNFIKGKDVAQSLDIKTKEFSFQGIGRIIAGGITTDNTLYIYPAPIIINGCMDPLASNFDSTATVDNGTCQYVSQVPGCMDPSASNYNLLANVDDGSCILDIYGCTNQLASNYDPLANIDDGSCLMPSGTIYGCTDPQATNYDPNASVDDGSCTYTPAPIFGCTDPTADNYDPQATADDGSCTYSNTGGGRNSTGSGGNNNPLYDPPTLTIQDTNDDD